MCAALLCLAVTFRLSFFFFFFNDTATTEIYTLSLHDALPICSGSCTCTPRPCATACSCCSNRSEEHTSELQSRGHLVCRLLLEQKKHTASLAMLQTSPYIANVNPKSKQKE